MNISDDHPLADYVQVLAHLGLRASDDDPLTLKSEQFTLIVEERRDNGEKFKVLITIPGFAGVPVSEAALLAVLQMSAAGGRFDARISNGEVALNFVMGFSRPITPKEILAVVATGKGFAANCEEIVRNFGGTM
jgi:hypothetical protein